MFQPEVFIRELLAVDALASGAVAAREVPALAHERGDDAVEFRSLLVVGITTHALLYTHTVVYTSYKP